MSALARSIVCRTGTAAPATSLRMLGAGALVAVGYIDPGNWATDIAGGSAYGYRLLSVVALASLLAMGLQTLVARVSLATGRDLASLFRDGFSRPTAALLHAAGELAILATAVAELVGGATALRLLFGLPLPAGLAATAIGTVAVLAAAREGSARHEQAVAALLAVVALCFVVLLERIGPDWSAATAGLVPDPALLAEPGSLFIAMGILGATIMPHNLYLHSGLLAERAKGLSAGQRRAALRLAILDAVGSLAVAMLLNGAILLVAAASLAATGATVDSLEGAHRSIGLALGAGPALLFAIALYAAGQSSAITGVMAGGYLSAGFAGRPAGRLRRGVTTRLAALAAALVLYAALGGAEPDRLLILSQVVLSAALPFVLVPLLLVARRRSLMGRLVLGRAATGLTGVAVGAILALNLYLLGDAAAA